MEACRQLVAPSAWIIAQRIPEKEGCNDGQVPGVNVI